MQFISLTHTRSQGRTDIKPDTIESIQVRPQGTLVKLTNGGGMYVDETPDEIHAKIKYQLIDNSHDDMGLKLKESVLKFMHDTKVYSKETIFQTDRVQENALEFIEELFHIVEPILPAEDANE